MSQPSRRRHKARPGTPAVPVLSRTDWVRLSLILLVAGVMFVGWSAFELRLSHEASLSRILSRVSALLRGRLEGFSSDRLFRFLNALDQEIEIVIRQTRKRSQPAGIRVLVPA